MKRAPRFRTDAEINADRMAALARAEATLTLVVGVVSGLMAVAILVSQVLTAG